MDNKIKKKIIPSMTVEMFIHTSKYMKFLLDEISQIPSDQIPYGVQQVSNELMDSLQKFSISANGKIKKNVKKPNSNHVEVQSKETDSLKYNSSASQTISAYEPGEADKFIIPSINKNEQTLNSSTSSIERYYVSELKDVKKKFYVTATFRHLLETVMVSSSENRPHHYYCRTCNIVFDRSDDWKIHLNESERHNTFADNQKFRNEELTCSVCNITIFGSIPLMQRYMDYHSIIHDSNDIDKEIHSINHDPTGNGMAAKENVTGEQNSYLTKFDINEYQQQRERINAAQSEQSSISTSFETHEANAQMERRERKKKNRQIRKAKILKQKLEEANKTETNISKSFSSDNITGENSISNDFEQRTESPSVPNVVAFKDWKTAQLQSPKPFKVPQPEMAQNDASPIIALLEEMKQYYLENKVKLMGSFCILCNESYLSQFDWMDHLENCSHIHNSSLETNVEVMSCFKCGLVVCGPRVIVSQLMNSVEHLEVDNLFS